MTEIRTRIAPSPTGDWHLGNARTALFAYLFARKHGGKFFLRIEDTDQNRLVEGSVDRLVEIIDWLGLETDDFNGQPYVVQSTRLPKYQELAKQLVQDGHAYYCFASSEELQAMRDEQTANKLPPRYDNRWGYRDLPLEESLKRVEAGEPCVVRQKMPLSGTIEVRDEVLGDIRVEAAQLDDTVLLKADGFPTYHLAHIVDDKEMAITHVIRGSEWLPSAPRHAALLDALGWERPVYAHLPTILGPDKGKLSKRHGAKSVLEYRDSGYLPEAINNFLLLLGWSSGDDREIFSKEDMVQAFSLERVQPNPAKFNAEKLDWFNGEYIRGFSSDDLRTRVTKFWHTDEVWRERLSGEEKTNRVLTAVASRMVTLVDFGPLAAIFYVRPTEWLIESLPAKGQTGEEAIAVLNEVKSRLENAHDWTHDGLKALLDELVTSRQLKPGQVYLPLRYALTSQLTSPSPLECLVALGREESLSRVSECIEYVHGQSVHTAA